MPTMTVPSAAMRRLRREGLEISRRRAALAPTGGVAVAKKPSPPPPYTYVLALPAPLPRRLSLERVPPPPPCAASSRSLHAAVEVTRSMCIGKGAQVRVRTRVGVARSTGQPIVSWLRAVVDSAADEDGYLHVTYTYTNGKLPRIACVAPSDVRLHDVAPTDARGAASRAAAGEILQILSRGNVRLRPGCATDTGSSSPPPHPSLRK
uniref:Uncharacterized protein n=1 Tax=Setaria viridis TaxID=4556 RepID=A0A4U6WB47_SETVI|nr:hypothetical protein SEVIR_2G340950v2 [Setaria viridis]